MTDTHKSDGSGSNRNRTLRLALAMRGGVSLAVWIGGAVAEIDLFRRACNELESLPEGENEYRRARANKYVELFSHTPYRHVDVDILAGASAGGLNAVLFGLAQCCGTVMDEPVRRTWIEKGGIWELLRDPGFCRVPSILKGNERLFTMVLQTLQIIADPDSPWTPDPTSRCARTDTSTDVPPKPQSRWVLQHLATKVQHMTVELAATLLTDPHDPSRSNRARFSFAKTPGNLRTRYSTIPMNRVRSNGDANRTVDQALDRLALAARATSSFPGAFEPAAIYATPRRPGDNPTARTPRFLTSRRAGINMARAFLYSRGPRNEKDPFNVVDGGIFDNIPIDRALRAIERAPASQPSERRLIYLDPEPPETVEPPEDAKKRVSAAGWLPVIRSSMALKQRSETAVDELGLILEHNNAVLETRGRLDALAAALRRASTESADEADQVAAMKNKRDFLSGLIDDDAYLQCRVAMDTPRFTRLLTDPCSELCHPPRDAVDYSTLPPSRALRIKDWVAKAYRRPLEGWQPSRDFYAMTDWVRVLLGWIHALEDLLASRSAIATGGDRDISGKLQVHKRRAYRCFAVIQEARHRTIDSVLAAPLIENLSPGETYGERVFAQCLVESHGVQSTLLLSPALIAELTLDDEKLPGEDDGKFYAALGNWPFPSLGDVPELRCGERVRGTLETLRQSVYLLSRNVIGEIPNDGDKPWQRKWNESVYAHFYWPPLRDLAMEDLAKVFAQTGVPSTASTITFHAVTGNTRPRIDVPVLEEAAKAKQLTAWLRQPPIDDERIRKVLEYPDQLVGADTKLAGNVMSRFGGFFKARWRENDWQWGRLDAAAGIATILNYRRGQTQPPFDQKTLDEHIALLQNSILEESAATVHDAPKDSGQRLAETAGADGMDAVSPHYRFALASRIVPLVYRALLPPKHAGWSVGGAAVWLGQALIRPIGVAVPLIADPLRLAMALVVVLGSASLLGAGKSDGLLQIAFCVVLIACSIAVAARAWKARENYEKVAGGLRKLATEFEYLDVDKNWMPILVEAKLSRYRQLSWALAIGMFSAASYHLAAMHFDWPRLKFPTETFLLGLVFIVGLQQWLNQRAYRAQRTAPGRARRKVMFGITSICALGVIAAGETIARIQDHSAASLQWWDHAPLWTAAVAGLSLGLLILISLHGWAADVWAYSLAVVTAVATAALQWGVTDSRYADWRGWDLLPTLLWLIVLGIAVPKLPCRLQNYGDDDGPRLKIPSATVRAAESPGPTPPQEPLVPVGERQALSEESTPRTVEESERLDAV
jgi:patatin-related protein